ncbi:MAG: excinuclease ABC subunit UvrA [Proteobacteria bacterium]|nr:excinuclease ABC subunit UvrA [Pseudomonadota bacterium]MCP4920996.1 excinuclease ABC subunit UvrA [Pseudomonadota bacterium]
MNEPSNDRIKVVNACEHNLQGVDLDLPRDSLVVFTGLSGSGKSSLAFDTIYQEGQRRFMESLSSYARQFLGKMERPHVDHVEGLSPTISIDQKTVNRNPRSTVGTVTEILDHLRLLLARLGTPHCPICDTPITALSPSQIVDDLLGLDEGTRLTLMAPIVRDRKGEYRKEMADLQKDGWVRARIDGELFRLDEPPTLARYEKHTIEVVVDRVKVKPESRMRILEAVERCLKLADGMLTALVAPAGKTPEHRTWSASRSCINHPKVHVPELEPRLFSFNAPQGACPECKGLGELVDFDDRLMLDTTARIPACFLPFGDKEKLPFSSITPDIVREVARHVGANLRVSWAKQPEAVQKALMYGEGVDYTYTTIKQMKGRKDKRTRAWGGIAKAVKNIWHFTHHGPFERFRRRHACGTCDGRRLNPVALAIRFREHDISQLSGMTVEESIAFFQGLKLAGNELLIGQELVREIRERLGFLDAVGLSYLALDRSSNTLSGGEAQRIRLAAQVGSGLQGVTYVLDEPSIGLHPRDNQRLLKTLLRLRDGGNSVLVVEHDKETMEAADHVVDIGPGAGVEGGRIVAQGPPGKLRGKESATARYLEGKDTVPLPEERRTGNGETLRVVGARANNLQDLTVDIPLGVLTAVTGVSGSGKSTLIVQTLQRALKSSLHKGKAPFKGKRAGEHDRVDGLDHIDKIIVINQAPIGRTPRSNPATYTGAFGPIRTLFSKLPEAKARGYAPGRFSFNVQGGRCEECQGAGVNTIEMQFLADVQVPCASCEGARFNAETLEVTYRGKHITDVLAMPVREAATFFENHRKLRRTFETLLSVGLGYVRLGQPSTTLSGGEAQRIKLATELQRPATGRTLYILDEPTTGLHFRDVLRLIEAIQRLVDAGNTVLVIEHDTDLIKVADHVIDLGPEGGSGGGLLIGQGTPEHIATLDTPTGQVLAALPDFGGAAHTFRPRKVRKKKVHESDLVVRGARCHNLKGVDVRIPKGSFTVVTGVSGSGKTSLAFDTIFSEGQRRYVECMSTYARRFLGRMDRPPVDKVEGLAPAIAIHQKAGGHNPRSTVATSTEIYDYLRLLWARLGTPHCPHCDRVVQAWSPSEGARRLKQEDGRGWLLAKLGPDSQTKERRQDLLRAGFLRLWSPWPENGGRETSLEDDDCEALLARGAWVVVDRLRPAKSSTSRLSEALSTAYLLGGNEAIWQPREGGEALKLTAAPTCPEHGTVGPEELTPRHFSFNSWLGSCPTCDGLGETSGIVTDLLLPKPHRPLWDALDKRVSSVLKRSKKQKGRISSLLRSMGLKLGTPVEEYEPEQLHALLYGSDVELTARWTKKWGKTKNNVVEEFEWPGIVSVINGWQSRLDWLRAQITCPACRGHRLRPEILAVRLGGTDISRHCKSNVDEALAFWNALELTPDQTLIGEQPLAEVRGRLQFLVDVGLGYLSLDRAAGTLSGGESQRIRLATQLGSGLTGCIYVLDEPTIGLHPRDTNRLLDTLMGLRDLGNTVLVVEHDADTIRRADRLIDMGPGAGEHGGEIVSEGTPAEVEADPSSLTGAFLSGRRAIPIPAKRRTSRTAIQLTGAHANNLKHVDAAFQTGCITAVTGVSGSGKSSLVMHGLVPALRAHFSVKAPPAKVGAVKVPSKIKRLIVVDQSPIGRSPRSTPATYSKLMDGLRNLYASTNDAKIRGFTKSRFTYNGAEARCKHCEGRGSILVEMHFLSDVWVVCEHCHGRRFNEGTLEVKWKGHSIADVLEMTVDEAIEVFRAHRRLIRPLQALHDVGLGYIRLGQSGTTFSGGEAQRIKLARELQGRTDGSVYVLDEPTTGLHFADVEKLESVLQRMVEQGATIVLIEHNVELIRSADVVIDIGPEGGDAGGEVLAVGTPEQLVDAGTDTGNAIAW